MAKDLTTVGLTGQRHSELERFKALLTELGVDYGESNQQAISAALQIATTYVERGGDVDFQWHDGRRNNGDVEHLRRKRD